MTTYESLIEIAKKRLRSTFDHIDFDTNPKTEERIAEILTTDALLKAGSTISIRWLSHEDQNRRLNGIENMMFDLALEDPALTSFYRTLCEFNAEKKGNHMTLKTGNFAHHSISIPAFA